MADSGARSAYDYIAYIDESGDPGLARVKPLDVRGSSEWLVVAAVLMAASHEPELPVWHAELVRSLNSRQMRDVHFTKLSDHRKLQACEHVAALPVRCFVVASNKQNMKGWKNPFAEKVPSDNWFYCWLTRLLLERVTHWVAHRSLRDFGELRKVKLIYSERGGLSYSQMNAYYEWLRSKGDNQFLAMGNLSFGVMDYRLLEVLNHAGHDGLKLPDIVASAFFKAADIHDTGACNPKFAQALRPRMARWPDLPGGQIAGYGVKLMPGLGKLRGRVDAAQEAIFRHYGYPAQWWATGGP